MQPFVINRRTDFKYIRLIDSTEKFHNSIFVGEARDMARDVKLDLVCFNRPEGRKLALCKIIDWGKWKYNHDKAKKKEQSVHKHTVKEVRFSPVIGDHDIGHKIKQINSFLKEGDEVLVTMRFKGIQKRNYSLGEERMNQIVGLCEEYGEVVNRKKTGNQIVVRLKQK